MTELERYKKAYTAAMGHLVRCAADRYNMAYEECKAILNPPPAVEMIEVERWAVVAPSGYIQENFTSEDMAIEYMARGDYHNHKVVRLVFPLTREVQKVETYTLELNKLEAETLLRIGQKVGGSPDTSRRKYMDAINRKLYEMGIEDPGMHITEPGGGITFREEDGLK